MTGKHTQGEPEEGFIRRWEGLLLGCEGPGLMLDGSGGLGKQGSSQYRMQARSTNNLVT